MFFKQVVQNQVLEDQSANLYVCQLAKSKMSVNQLSVSQMFFDFVAQNQALEEQSVNFNVFQVAKGKISMGQLSVT